MIIYYTNNILQHFCVYLQRHNVIESDSIVTALVPSKVAFRNLSDSDEAFWFDYYRLPHLLQYVFGLTLRTDL